MHLGKLQHCRFIPAHAGNSSSAPAHAGTRAVHPRARGEQLTDVRAQHHLAGSSPRTRGTGPGSEIHRLRVRFIPAHAGNSSSWPGSGRGFPVHPRARGEQARESLVQVYEDGSSPRTRGTGDRLSVGDFEERFIPAHAGNSGGFEDMNSDVPVHPRARGEQVLSNTSITTMCGSSPRTRGTDSDFSPIHVMLRFIPAHAGNRAPCPFRSSPTAVHPRARGEQSVMWGLLMLCCGSSPRTRGTAGADRLAVGRSRFIPAHAGNSAQEWMRPSARSVHPRARGEQ